MAVIAILKQKPDLLRDEIADKISKTVRTVQRALDSLRDKGYIRRAESTKFAPEFCYSYMDAKSVMIKVGRRSSMVLYS